VSIFIPNQFQAREALSTFFNIETGSIVLKGLPPARRFSLEQLVIVLARMKKTDVKIIILWSFIILFSIP
jgi:hypothetical protein